MTNKSIHLNITINYLYDFLSNSVQRQPMQFSVKRLQPQVDWPTEVLQSTGHGKSANSLSISRFWVPYSNTKTLQLQSLLPISIPSVWLPSCERDGNSLTWSTATQCSAAIVLWRRSGGRERESAKERCTLEEG